MSVVEIEKLVPGGMGLARTSDGVALIEGVLPGERVEVELRQRKNHLEGSAKKIIRPHPARVDLRLPPSANLPLEYPEQLPIKQSFVEEALARIARVQFPISTIQGSPDSLHYRTATQYALHPMGGLAYRKPGSNDLVKLERDLLAAPPLEEAFKLLSSWPISNLEEIVMRGSLYENRTQLGFVGGAAKYFKKVAQALVQEGVAGVVWAEQSPKGRFRGSVQHLAGDIGLLEDFGGILSTVNVQSFAQVNPRAASLMYLEAAHIAGKGQKALELYAGSGV